MRKKEQDVPDDAGFAGTAPSPRMTPEDVQRKEFRLAFRGYNERDVDAFLDQVTEELGAYLDENRRLREQLHAAGVGAAAGTPPGADADAVARASREAEETLADARAEAERIVADARERAERLTVSGAAAGATQADARAIIAPFLGREREFLQSLGKLVQDHAETVRGMVHAARQGALGGAGAPEPVHEGPGPGPITVPESEPVEPAASAQAEQQVVPGEGGDPERQRSLRELFWGED
ncbi:MAG: DivIVA domain-containing protein [Candidatus Velamenicoccus archaeovorus]